MNIIISFFRNKMPKAKSKKSDPNSTINVIEDINDIIGDLGDRTSQDEEELLKLEKIADEIEAEEAVLNIPQAISPLSLIHI